MLENHQTDYSAAALDPDLLATPVEVQTRWHVITGAPCSGKSTLIGQLAGRGSHTAAEAGRQYFERELATGRRIEEIRREMRSAGGALNGHSQSTVPVSRSTLHSQTELPNE